MINGQLTRTDACVSWYMKRQPVIVASEKKWHSWQPHIYETKQKSWSIVILTPFPFREAQQSTPTGCFSLIAASYCHCPIFLVAPKSISQTFNPIFNTLQHGRWSLQWTHLWLLEALSTTQLSIMAAIMTPLPVLTVLKTELDRSCPLFPIEAGS